MMIVFIFISSCIEQVAQQHQYHLDNERTRLLVRMLPLQEQQVLMSPSGAIQHKKLPKPSVSIMNEAIVITTGSGGGSGGSSGDGGGSSVIGGGGISSSSPVMKADRALMMNRDRIKDVEGGGSGGSGGGGGSGSGSGGNNNSSDTNSSSGMHYPNHNPNSNPNGIEWLGYNINTDLNHDISSCNSTPRSHIMALSKDNVNSPMSLLSSNKNINSSPYR